MNQITLGSLFDGIAGFPEAGRRNDIKAIWASEIEPFPLKVSAIRFPAMEPVGDITKMIGAELEPVDIITGGSPCQDLSVAGKRAGLAGARSGLFMEQIRIIKEARENDKCNGRTGIEIRPRFMVWENVPGAFSSNKGEDFRAVLEETAKIANETVVIPEPPKGKWNTVGCIMGNGWSIAWRILDAQHWGVPQRRRRIFLVADFGGQSAPEILFKREGLSRHLAESKEAREGITTDVERSTNTPITVDFGRTSDRIEVNPSVAVTLKGTGGGGGAKTGLYCIPKVYGVCSDGSNSMKSSNPHSGIYEADTTRTLDQNGGNPACNQGSMAVVQAAGFNGFKSVSGSIQYQEDTAATLEANMPGNVISGTVSAKWAKGTGGPAGDECQNLVVSQPYQKTIGALCARDYKGIGNQYVDEGKCIVEPKYSVRRLTPLECERLQDYKDGWTNIPGASDSARYKALGNSVAVCCPEYVLEGIADILNQRSNTNGL